MPRKADKNVLEFFMVFVKECILSKINATDDRVHTLVLRCQAPDRAVSGQFKHVYGFAKEMLC